MADKAISELVAAEKVKPGDLFVLEQDSTAKKLTGQTLENWLVSFADGHGGIQSLEKAGAAGLVDTYRITLADTTTFDFTVTNGKSIASIVKTNSKGLVDTYTITYNDGDTSTFVVANGRGIKRWTESVDGLTHTYTITYSDDTFDTFTVKDGEKGDKGDNTYTWIKYASQEPTAGSHSMGDVPDNWIGIYTGTAETAPTDWTAYQWYCIKGEKGDTGDPAALISSKVEYQASDSGTIIPSGVWSDNVPVVAQGRYLWTRVTQTFNSGSPVVSYSVTRMGMDGAGTVSSVAGVSPDSDGNVNLSAEDVGARPNTWTPTAAEIGARPDTWMPSADEVGALSTAGGSVGTIKIKTAGTKETCDIVFSRPDDYEYDAHIDILNNNLRIYRYDRSNAIATVLSLGLADGALTVGGGTLTPTMSAGTEYKLGERWMGNPVYAKLVDFGALPNSTYKSVSTGVGTSKIISVYGFGYNATDGAFMHFPTVHGGAIGAACFVNSSGGLVVETYRDMSAWVGKFIVKYTK